MYLHGQPATTMPPDKRARLGLGRSFQDPRLCDGLTVLEILSLSQRVLGRPLLRGLWVSRRSDRARRLNATLERFSLVSVANERLRTLSLGMARVTMLACLFISEADVWLLDEPASGLARAEVDALAPLLRSLVDGSSERSVILVEHDATLVQRTADRVILLERGKAVEDASEGSAAWHDIVGGRRSAARSVAPVRPISHPDRDATSVSTLAGRDLHISYGKFVAVRGVSVEVPVGEIRCLIGTNGAGKSTVMRALAGLLTPAAGSITLDGGRVPPTPHQRVVDAGIVLVAGGQTVFPNLTVSENLQLTRGGPLDVLDLFPTLALRQRQLAGTLSGGEQQMLGVARGLQLSPRFLLVDELSLGLAEDVVDRIILQLTTLVSSGQMGVLLVEQDYSQALRWSSHAYVLAQGRLEFSGPSEDAEKRPDLFRPVFLPEAPA